jgi:hypothetical protein
MFVPKKPTRVDHPKVEQFLDAHLYCRLLALPANISLNWKDLPVTNTLAYFANSLVTVMRGFKILTSRINAIDLLNLCELLSLLSKLECLSLSCLSSNVYLWLRPINLLQ